MDGPQQFPGHEIGPAELGDLRFARLLAVLGLAILALAALLMVLPSRLEGSLLVYLIAYGIVILFGPAGFSLLAAAWRIRNRAVHGTEMPPFQRRRFRLFGAALVLVGIMLAFSGFGVTGSVSRALNLVWGLSLAFYGLRFLFRSFVADRT